MPRVKKKDWQKGVCCPQSSLLSRSAEESMLFPSPSSSMPDIVNLHCTGLIRLCLWINACLIHSLLENRVRESEVSSNAMIEGVVAGRFIMMAPC